MNRCSLIKNLSPKAIILKKLILLKQLLAGCGSSGRTSKNT